MYACKLMQYRNSIVQRCIIKLSFSAQSHHINSDPGTQHTACGVVNTCTRGSVIHAHCYNIKGHVSGPSVIMITIGMLSIREI